ncbi:MAG: PD40 domain-containing protein [Acidobacteria bacterium]|nr:PD40 domain-containing protein [Acidobacteriota bacterium]
MSPDGRFLAYSSPASGSRQVYVVPLPIDGRRWQISPDYGREPLWSQDGRQLFFHGQHKILMQWPSTSAAATR